MGEFCCFDKACTYLNSNYNYQKMVWLRLLSVNFLKISCQCQGKLVSLHKILDDMKPTKHCLAYEMASIGEAE